MTVTIYHNPRCSTSRNTLAIIREHGIEPEIVEYLKTPPDRDLIVELLAATGLSPRELVRAKQAEFSELGLDDPAVTDDQLIDAMAAHPVLIERPVVVAPKGARLCRPKERVLEIL
ncbi:MAG: arsenate reductase (glutaredoxin) [Rhizobiaceae bacterium]